MQVQHGSKFNYNSMANKELKSEIMAVVFRISNFLRRKDQHLKIKARANKLIH
jgi:hypothetical protein